MNNWYKVSKFLTFESKWIQHDRELFYGIFLKTSQNTNNDENTPDNEKSDDKQKLTPSQEHTLKDPRLRGIEGRQIEQEIINRINEKSPFIVKGTGKAEDIAGTDGYIIGYRMSPTSTKQVSPQPIQIKRSNPGVNYLKFEIMMGWPPIIDVRTQNVLLDGKDIKNLSIAYYFFVNWSDGGNAQLRVCNGPVIREAVKEIMNYGIKSWMQGSYHGGQIPGPGNPPKGFFLTTTEKSTGSYRYRNGMKALVYVDLKEVKPTYDLII